MRLEMKLLDEAVARGLPVLGICRGEQLLNVYFGGSLHQDLPPSTPKTPPRRTILPRKRVVLEPGSRLIQLLGPDERVNALHRQGIDRIGEELVVAGRDRNGIVQAIEHATLPFLVGVQWHPEYLPQIGSQRAIFRALVCTVRADQRLAAPASRIEASLRQQVLHARRVGQPKPRRRRRVADVDRPCPLRQPREEVFIRPVVAGEEQERGIGAGVLKQCQDLALIRPPRLHLHDSVAVLGDQLGVGERRLER